MLHWNKLNGTEQKKHRKVKKTSAESSLCICAIHIHANMHHLLNKFFFYRQGSGGVEAGSRWERPPQVRCSDPFLMTASTRLLQTKLITPWMFLIKGFDTLPNTTYGKLQYCISQEKTSELLHSCCRRYVKEVKCPMFDSGRVGGQGVVWFMFKRYKFTIQSNFLVAAQ